jgi:hypothetical protein
MERHAAMPARCGLRTVIPYALMPEHAVEVAPAQAIRARSGQLTRFIEKGHLRASRALWPYNLRDMWRRGLRTRNCDSTRQHLVQRNQPLFDGAEVVCRLLELVGYWHLRSQPLDLAEYRVRLSLGYWAFRPAPPGTFQPLIRDGAEQPTDGRADIIVGLR